MIRKFICTFLAIVMAFSSISVFAARTVPPREYDRYYYVGETECAVTASDCIFADNASISSEGVEISAGGQATWGFYLPYASRSVMIVYEGSGNITLKTNENTYNTITLSGEGEDLLEFGVNLGYDQKPQWRYWVNYNGAAMLQEYVEHRGEKTVTITASEDVVIKELLFEKEFTMGPRTTNLPNISDAVKETMSTVVIHENASVILVNGGRRYVDNNDVTKRPVLVNGSMYLPINTLAKALGYYHEDIPEENYAMMRSEWHTVVMLDGAVTIAEGTAKPIPAPSNAIIRHNGETLAAVRYFGELAGECVEYKDGLVVIDNKYAVKRVLNNSSYYSHVYEKISPFISVKKTGVTYYVAQNDGADDNNSGTFLSPFRTLNKAAEVAKAGDTVIVCEGVYRETLTPKNNGEPGAPITFKAAEGHDVTISAADELDAPYLIDAEKGEYILEMPMDLGIGKNQIYIDDVALPEARYPDNAERHVQGDFLSDLWPDRGEIYKQAGDLHTFFSDTLLNQPDDYWVGGIYVGTFGYGYATLTGLITDSTNGSFTVSDKYRNQVWWWEKWANCVTNDWAHSPNYGIIIGHINAMNLPGEWVRTDDGRLHIILPEGCDPTTVKIEAKARQLIADLTDRKYINIEGFKTIGGSVTMGEKGEMCMLNGLDMKYINHYTLSADSRNGYIDFIEEPIKLFYYDNTVPGAPQRGEVGVYLGGSDEIIVNCKMDQAAGAAIYMTGTYGYIENNIIDQCGYMSSYTSGIHCDTLVWKAPTAARGGHSFYNNTVGKSGQSGLDFCKLEWNTKNENDVPILPCEIAYNDFHDCNLASVDAGAVYCNGCNAGFDEQMTTVHHNYVYKTTDSETSGNSGDGGIYWDGNANGFETYDNMTFNIGSEGFNYDMIVQPTSPAESYERLWDNQSLDTISINSEIPVADALEDGFFTENQPFFAGSTIDREKPYANNLNRFRKGAYSSDYLALNAEVSDGVALNQDNGHAYFSADGQYIHFKDVDFGEMSDEISISYLSNSNWASDILEIYVDSMESPTRHLKIELPSDDPPDKSYTCSVRKKFSGLGGIHDVWIKVSEFYSVAIGGISVMKRAVENPLQSIDDWALHIYTAEYTDYVKNNPKSPGDFFVKDGGLGTEKGGANGVRSTWAGYTVRYAAQEITDDVSCFVMAAGSRAQYLGQLINVYLCEPTDLYAGPSGEPVAQFRTRNDQFYDRTPLSAPVLKDIEPGVYDVYIEFSEADGLGKTSNISYFGFLKEGVDETQYSIAAAPKRAELYDAELSVIKNDRPFTKIIISRLDGYERALFNTLPGTIAAYKDVRSIGESTGFAIRYYIGDERLAGQPVTIRVKDADGNDISKGQLVTEACEENTPRITTCKLDTPVPEGYYTVYVEFGGEEGSDKCNRLHWLGFTE